MAGLFSKSQNTVTEQERISGFQVNQATYGAVVPIVFGTTRISGNILDYYDFTAIQHSETTRTGKGGGGSSSTNITYTYKAAVLVGLCEGQITSVGRVWQGSDTITTLAALGFTLFSGAVGQSAWDYTQTKLPAHSLPYSGLAYVAGYVDLTSNGGMYTYNFEVAGLLRDGDDCNPADICNYIMTDSVNGIGITGVNSTALANFHSFAAAADLLGSMPLTDQSKAYTIVNNLCEACDVMVFDSQGELKFVPRCEDTITGNGVTYTPDLTVQYDLDEDDFLPFDDGVLVQFERTSQAETYNQATVEFINRANNYETETVDKQVLADVSTRGLRPAGTKTYHFFHTKARAEQVATRLALKSCYDRVTYEFRLPWNYGLLEPGDIVTLSLSSGPLLLNRVPVRIETVEEDDDGELEITAKPLLSGVATPARYTVYDSDRASRDFNVSPGASTAPAIIDLPTVLTDGIIKTSIATSGGSNWGGANVWVSDDGNTYKQVGSLSAKSRYGTLTASLPDSATTIDATNTLSVDLSISGGTLSGGTQADAQNYRTLCWVDGEIIAYATATLTGANKYNLSYLVRGCYGTPITSHTAGTEFVRLDSELFGYSHSLADIGKTVYVKLQGFNVYGAGVEDLSDVTACQHTIQQYFVPQVSGLTCSQAYRETGATITYELTLTWATPDADVYSGADVFVRSNVATETELGTLTPAEVGNVAVNRIGLDVVQWKQIGSGTNKFTFAGAVYGATYKFMVVAKDRNGVSADSGHAPTIEYIVVVKPYTPVMPSGLSLSVSDKAYATWSANTDTDVDFYELRTDNNPGNATGLLFRGSALQCNPTLTSRNGTLYLFAHNPSGKPNGKYSPALSYGYNFPKASAPTVTITEVFQGILISTNALPTRSIGVNFHIDEAVFFDANNTYTFKTTGGIFAVSAAFVDYFGEGQQAATVTQVVRPRLDGSYIHITENTAFDQNVIVQGVLAANAVIADNIAAGAVIAEKIAVDAIEARHIKAGEIDATVIKQGGVSLDNLMKECWTPCWKMRVWNNIGSWYDAANYLAFPTMSYPSLGSITFLWATPDYVMFEINVTCTSPQTVQQYVSRVDDEVYIFVNGFLLANYAQSGSTITYNFPIGDSKIQVFVGDTLGADCGITLLGDIINGTTIRFNG